MLSIFPYSLLKKKKKQKKGKKIFDLRGSLASKRRLGDKKKIRSVLGGLIHCIIYQLNQTIIRNPRGFLL